MSATRDMRVGIIGFGTRGQLFASILAARPDASLSAVLDSDVGRAELAVQWGAIPCTTKDAFFGAGLDVVIVTTPDFAHREPVELAAQAGCHIMVEKPFAASLADCDAMIQAIERAGVLCLPAYENRWNLPFVKAKRAIEAGTIGRVLIINGRLNGLVHVPTTELSWAGRTSPGWFLMSHVVDLAVWYMGGVPTRVTAAGVKQRLVAQGIDTYDAIEAVVEYADGAVAVFESCWVLPDAMANPDDFEVRIIGTAGALEVNTFNQMVTATHDRFTYPEILRFEDVNGQLAGFPVFMLNTFLDDIMSGRPARVTLGEARASTEILEAIHKAIVGGPQELRPAVSGKGA